MLAADEKNKLWPLSPRVLLPLRDRPGGFLSTFDGVFGTATRIAKKANHVLVTAFTRIPSIEITL